MLLLLLLLLLIRPFFPPRPTPVIAAARLPLAPLTPPARRWLRVGRGRTLAQPKARSPALKGMGQPAGLVALVLVVVVMGGGR